MAEPSLKSRPEKAAELVPLPSTHSASNSDGESAIKTEGRVSVVTVGLELAVSGERAGTRRRGERMSCIILVALQAEAHLEKQVFSLG